VGIRHFHVTGVQTCALPIFTQYACGSTERTGCDFVLEDMGTLRARDRSAESLGASLMISFACSTGTSAPAPVRSIISLYPATMRSEERRVGTGGKKRRRPKQ